MEFRDEYLFSVVDHFVNKQRQEYLFAMYILDLLLLMLIEIYIDQYEDLIHLFEVNVEREFQYYFLFVYYHLLLMTIEYLFVVQEYLDYHQG